MESSSGVADSGLHLKFAKPFCRCCFSTEKRVENAAHFEEYFKELAGLTVSVCDGVPQWVCCECGALLRKAARFKHKILRAHQILCNYFARGAPLLVTEIDSPFCSTEVLSFSVPGKVTGNKCDSHTVLTHHNKTLKPATTLLDSPMVSNSKESDLKCETTSSDCDDNNIILKKVKCTDKEIQESKPAENIMSTRSNTAKKKTHNSSSNENSADEDTPEPKLQSPRSVPLDPKKIRVVYLTEEEQARQREEDRVVGLKAPFQCTLCFRGFNYESTLHNHMKKHTALHGRFQCDVCQMYFSSQYSHGLHSQMHVRRFECVKCGRRMIDRASILEHYRTQHEGVIYICNTCGKVFNNFKTHQSHIRSHHRGVRPKCEVCGKTFVSKHSLGEHMRIHAGLKTFECSPCNLKFRTISQLRQHRNTHHDASTTRAQDYYCVECDERFKTIHNLRKHLQQSLKHQDEKDFKFGCLVCGRRFSSGPRAARHSRVQHEGERAHRCSTCGAGLASRSSLHKHELSVHGGRRPSASHVCHTCGRAFRSKNILVNHIRTHTGEKPFACSECGRCFAQQTTMQTHYKLVHLKITRKEKLKPEIVQKAVEPKLAEIAK